MGRREAVPLYKTRHVAFVKAILNEDDPDKAIASHLSIGTGPRGDTICHTHSSWFIYDKDGSLYYRIPHSDKPCRKGDNASPCGGCKSNNHEGGYEPKTPAGEGRRILIPNKWTNPVTREKEYFGLRDAVESYFALDGERAPDGVQHGHKMIGGDGICRDTLNRWLRDIAAQSTISPELREDRLRDEITIDEDREVAQIKQFDTDSEGNGIPDVFSHDMRATYITHLMRNDVPRTKAIVKTGHKKPDSMNPYVRFAEKEIDATEESAYY